MRKLGAVVIGLSLLAFLPASYATTIETKAEFAYILDFETGKVLFQKKSEQLMPPASMSKLMTAYMVFEQLELGNVTLKDKFQISQTAFDRRGSSMFAQLKSKIAIDDLLQGLIVVSGNDAAIALAEGLANDEQDFAIKMQTKARDIGLTKSTFSNATGWPDANQQMTLHDLGRLAYVLIEEFPQFYHYFGQERFKWGKVDQPNRNILLDDGIGVDGLKTGRTEESGYGIVTSALRDDRRVIIVLNGLQSAQERARETRRLIDWAFSAFKKYKIYSRSDVVGQVDIAGGVVDQVSLVPKQDVTTFINIENIEKLKAEIIFDSPIMAPVKKNQEIGKLYISSDDGLEHVVILVAEKHVAKGGRVDQSIDILWSWVDKKLNSMF